MAAASTLLLMVLPIALIFALGASPEVADHPTARISANVADLQALGSLWVATTSQKCGLVQPNGHRLRRACALTFW